MIDMIDAVAHKANFTYKLYMPSGMGASCLPEPIDKDDPECFLVILLSDFQLLRNIRHYLATPCSMDSIVLSDGGLRLAAPAYHKPKTVVGKKKIKCMTRA